MLDSLAAVLGATQQHTVLACGALQSQLVKGEALTTSLQQTRQQWQQGTTGSAHGSGGQQSGRGAASPGHAPCACG